MSDFSINVTIAGRTYPLTIERNEEEHIRKAAQVINDNIKHLQDNYAVKDMQDLLAMTALEYSTDLIVKKGSVEQEKTSEKLMLLNQKLSDYLNSN